MANEGRGRVGLVVGLLVGLSGCAAPASRFPNGQAALDRMKAIYDCSHGVKAEARLDHRSKAGRIRGNLSFYAVDPARVRFSVFSPFGAELATLASDGQRFSFVDTFQKRFIEGPASTCNIAHMTQVPIPGHALVSLLQGRAPLLVHDPAQVSISWNGPTLGLFGRGHYEIEIPSKNDAKQTIHLEVNPADVDRPWAEQRLRVTEVRVEQKSVELYRAQLDQFRTAKAGQPIVDEDGIDPPIPPIGPACPLEVPGRIQVDIAARTDDVLFEYKDIEVNPAVPEGVFVQMQPAGTQRLPVGECDRGW